MTKKRPRRRPSTSPGPNGDSPQITPPVETKVDQIRDIIFGAHIEEYDQRFRRLEAQLVDESGKLRTEVTQRLEAIAAEMRAALEREQAERRGAVQELVESGQGLSTALESATGQLHRQISKLGETLSGRLDQESDARLQQVAATRAELVALIERHATDLLERKADRTQIAKLLANLAAGLNDEPSGRQGKRTKSA